MVGVYTPVRELHAAVIDITRPPLAFLAPSDATTHGVSGSDVYWPTQLVLVQLRPSPLPSCTFPVHLHAGKRVEVNEETSIPETAHTCNRRKYYARGLRGLLEADKLCAQGNAARGSKLWVGSGAMDWGSIWR